MKEKAEVYTKLADLNQEIRQIRKQMKVCGEIQKQMPEMEQQLQRINPSRSRNRCSGNDDKQPNPSALVWPGVGFPKLAGILAHYKPTELSQKSI